MDSKRISNVFLMDFASMSGGFVILVPNRVLMQLKWFPMNFQLISNGFQIGLR